MDDVMIKVEHLTKDFKLPHEKATSIKSIVVNFWRHDRGYELQRALNDISFEIKKGEFFGIVGRNGSGKSTLLKLLAGTYTPTKGRIEVNGRLTPFIELGVGFNPELTGRENVFLNGALLGFNRKEMLAMYKDIVEFAELERFMDQKLKNYSSGMQVRLAFSIAIRAESDILLLDEVLAVGDEAFQRKCYNYFSQLKKNKQTMVLVTHDMGAIEKYCDRALMLEDSKIIDIGNPREIALKYTIANSQTSGGNQRQDTMKRPANPSLKIESVHFVGKSKIMQVGINDDIEVIVNFKVNKELPVQLNLYIVNSEGRYLAGINTTKDIAEDYVPKVGKHSLRCVISKKQLPQGEYTINVGAYTKPPYPEVIDLYDSSYGADSPRVRVNGLFGDRDGQFYLRGKWEKK